MAGLRLSTDILSPINSAFSINDESTLSFECSAGTPEFDLNSPGNRPYHEGLSIKFCSSTSNDNVLLENIHTDIKRQTDMNAEKERKYRNTYKQLKPFMDDLFDSKTSDVPSPVKKQLHVESITCGLKTEKRKEKQQNSEATTEMLSSAQEYTKAPNSKLQENVNKTKKYRKSNHLSKNECPSKEPVKASRSKVNIINKDEVLHKSQMLKSPEVSSSVHIPVTTKPKRESLLSHYSNQKRNVSSAPAKIENKAISIEKSIQIAISMHLECIHHMMQDQNISFRKEMVKLQEIQRKQNEETNYLFSVLEELQETNKKLISFR